MTVSRKLEFALPLFLIVLHGPIYNQIGNLAGTRGVDFGPAVKTVFDSHIPFVPLMVLPYMVAWLYPVLLVIGLAMKDGVGAAAVRRIIVAVILLQVICYTIWIALPVRVSLRIDELALADHGWLGHLVQLNYDNSTLWNACPSFHVAGPWLFLRAAQLYDVRFTRALLVLFVLIALSTVTVRIHYLLDIFVGLLVGELVFRLALRSFEAKQSFRGLSSKTTVAIYAAILAGATGGFVILKLSVG